MNAQVDAITIGVTDLKRARQFYEQGLGCRVEFVAERPRLRTDHATWRRPRWEGATTRQPTQPGCTMRSKITTALAGAISVT
jgi:catechol 2,3-dioxygenase-like lactoylglutathione lyase family enzyme